MPGLEVPIKKKNKKKEREGKYQLGGYIYWVAWESMEQLLILKSSLEY